MKIKMFAWFLLSDRLNTKDMLQRRYWQVSNKNNFMLRVGHSHEDRDHLFFNCNFSLRVWNYLQISSGYELYYGRICKLGEEAIKA
jgi:hypothetical protein